MNETSDPDDVRGPEAEAESEPPSRSADERARREKAEADQEAANLMAKLEMDVFGHP